jgi:hypothetical protein
MADRVTELERRRALDAFVQGWTALQKAEAGEEYAPDEALTYLHECLEWITLQTWPSLWVEVQLARADAYTLRIQGDALANARRAIACYRAAIVVHFEDLWRILAREE